MHGDLVLQLLIMGSIFLLLKQNHKLTSPSLSTTKVPWEATVKKAKWTLSFEYEKHQFAGFVSLVYFGLLYVSMVEFLLS